MRKNLLSVVIAATVLASASAHAGAFFEPYAGYHFGTSSVKSLPGAPTIDSSFQGLGFGGRVGLMLSKTMYLAADGGYAMLTNDDDEKFTLLQVGGVLGANFGKFRLWGGVNPLNTLNVTDDDIDIKGMGYKAGLGWMLAKGFSLSAEYQLNPATEYNGADVPDSATVTNNSFFISFSAPFGMDNK